MPSSMRSAPAAGSSCRISNEVSAIGIARRDERNEGRAIGALQFGEACGDAAHISSPNAAAAVNTSLSPRPERQTTMILSLRHLRRDAHHMGDRMRGLQRGDDAFELAEQHEGFKRLFVGGREIFHAALIACSQECSGPTPG